MAKYISILAAFLMVLVGCEAPVEVDESAWTNQASEEQKKMALVPVGPAPGGPFTTILCPDDGNPATAEDIRRSTSALLRNDQLLDTDVSNRVLRAGDTMTGTLTINAGAVNSQALYAVGNGTFPAIYALGGATGKGIVVDAGTNQDAILSTGNGTGFGIRGIGGASGGGGGRFEATAPGSMGISTVGASGGGSGIVASGGAGGPGVEAYSNPSQTAAAPQMGAYIEGYIRLASPNPNAGVDPGANGAVFAGSVARARGRIFLGGAPPYSFIGKKPLNFVALATVVGLGTTRVTMVRPMADLNYEVQLTNNGGIGYSVAETNIAGRTTTQFEFTVFNTTTAVAGVGTAEYVDIAVFGEQ